MEKIKLFCLPYAGGSALLYKKWTGLLDASIDMQPVELAGRGKRIHEPMYTDINQAVEDLYHILAAQTTGQPYALLGHSMGAMLAYLLSQKIRKEALTQPVHVFFSGRGAPHVKKVPHNYHLLPDPEFRVAIEQLGGTPPALFDCPELLELFLPLLRNDFRLAATDLSGERVCPLDYPITVFLGKDEEITAEQSDGWKRHTNATCHLHYLEGDHFFLQHKAEEMTVLINQALLANASYITAAHGISNAN